MLVVRSLALCTKYLSGLALGGFNDPICVGTPRRVSIHHRHNSDRKRGQIEIFPLIGQRD